MISLYPSHIHISFSYSHILSYPYISHIPVSVFLSIPPVALPLVFSFLIFMAWETGRVFLVVFRCRYCGEFLPRSSFRLSLRFVPRFASRPALRLVFPFCSSPCLSPCSSVRFSVWACWAGGSCVAPFCSALWERVGVCSFSCFGVVAAMWGVSYR